MISLDGAVALAAEKLADPARGLFDLLGGAPGERFSGDDAAARPGA